MTLWAIAWRMGVEGIFYSFLIVGWNSFTKSQLLKLELPHMSSVTMLRPLVKMVASKELLKWSPRFQGRKWLIPGSLGLCDWSLQVGLVNCLQLVHAKFIFV